MLNIKLRKFSDNLAKQTAQKLVRFPIFAPITLILLFLIIIPFALFARIPTLFKLLNSKNKIEHQ
jgi:hypothetical protein